MTQLAQLTQTSLFCHNSGWKDELMKLFVMTDCNSVSTRPTGARIVGIIVSAKSEWFRDQGEVHVKPPLHYCMKLHNHI